MVEYDLMLAEYVVESINTIDIRSRNWRLKGAST